MDQRERIAIADRFAKALDVDDFDTARGLLAVDCTYDAPRSRISGADAIIASYEVNAAWARSSFDELKFESRVAELSPGVIRITYTDITEHGGQRHVYQCCQDVHMGDDGLIGHIVHVEIPGQKESLDEFTARVGVKRPSEPRPSGSGQKGM
ncbi:MAG: nuclear transport factor 2 family protein [Planctomycetota bacterium]|jgi:hypothetical protein